jgi:hypothetical protein
VAGGVTGDRQAARPSFQLSSGSFLLNDNSPELRQRVGTLCPAEAYSWQREASMAWNWRDFAVAAIFVLLFGAATVANVGESSLPQLRGAWVAQALR